MNEELNFDDDIYTYDTGEVEPEDLSSVPDCHNDPLLDAAEIGTMLAIAESIAQCNQNLIIDSNTDQENWDRAMKLSPPERSGGKLRPFEQMIDDICTGKRSLFDKRR